MWEVINQSIYKLVPITQFRYHDVSGSIGSKVLCSDQVLTIQPLICQSHDPYWAHKNQKTKSQSKKAQDSSQIQITRKLKPAKKRSLQ